MKKFWLASIATLMLTLGSIAAFSNSNNPVYTPIIEGVCITQNWPQPVTPYTLACIPGGSQTCTVSFCDGILIFK